MAPASHAEVDTQTSHAFGVNVSGFGVLGVLPANFRADLPSRLQDSWYPFGSLLVPDSWQTYYQHGVGTHDSTT